MTQGVTGRFQELEVFHRKVTRTILTLSLQPLWDVFAVTINHCRQIPDKTSQSGAASGRSQQLKALLSCTEREREKIPQSELRKLPSRMSSQPKRRLSKDLPPQFSILRDKLLEYAALFIQQFDRSEQKLGELVKEFSATLKIARATPRKTWLQSAAEAAAVGATTAGLLVLWPLAGGLALGLGGTALAGGGAALVSAVFDYIMSDSDSAKKIEKHGQILREIVVPLTGILEEIRLACGGLKKLLNQAKAEKTLRDREDFQWTLRQVSQLEEAGEEALSVCKSLTEVTDELVKFVSSSEEKKKLAESVVQTAGQAEEMVDDLRMMSKRLEAFRGEYKLRQRASFKEGKTES